MILNIFKSGISQNRDRQETVIFPDLCHSIEQLSRLQSICLATTDEIRVVPRLLRTPLCLQIIVGKGAFLCFLTYGKEGMKEIPHPLETPQDEEHQSIPEIGKAPPADAVYWGKVGRPDYFAIVYLWKDKIVYVDGHTKKICKIEQNDGSMKAT